MKNKTIAVLGIVAYVLSVLSSATDLEGNPKAPIFLVTVSGIVTLLFIIMAIIRLWKNARWLSLVFASSAIILFILTVIQGFTLSLYGSPIIILSNIFRLVYFINTILVIIKLFRFKK